MLRRTKNLAIAKLRSYCNATLTAGFETNGKDVEEYPSQDGQYGDKLR